MVKEVAKGFWDWLRKAKLLLAVVGLALGGVVWSVSTYEGMNFRLDTNQQAIKSSQSAIETNQQAIKSNREMCVDHAKEDDRRTDGVVIAITALQTNVENIEKNQNQRHLEQREDMQKIMDKIDRIHEP